MPTPKKTVKPDAAKAMKTVKPKAACNTPKAAAKPKAKKGA